MTSVTKIEITSEEVNLSEAAVSAAVVRDLIDNKSRLIFQWVCCAIVGQSIATFGIVTNIINIICFIKQGFRDPVNISLLGLSISDLCSMVTVTWTYTCYNPALMSLDLNFDPLELQLLIGTWPSVKFNHVTSCITAFITVERCLCVAMPIKVKTIVTPTRVTAIIISIYVFILAAVAPIYCVSGHGWKFSTFRNKTLLGVVFTDNRVETENITYAINNIIIPFCAFGIVIMCTAILVISLRHKTQWRTRFAAANKSEQLSTRDQKVAKMMTMIAFLFVATFIPICIISIFMIAVPQFSMDGRFQNSLFCIGSIVLMFQSTNSACNIFIYYNMSSKYRDVFHQSILCHQTAD